MKFLINILFSCNGFIDPINKMQIKDVTSSTGGGKNDATEDNFEDI